MKSIRGDEMKFRGWSGGRSGDLVIKVTRGRKHMFHGIKSSLSGWQSKTKLLKEPRLKIVCCKKAW